MTDSRRNLYNQRKKLRAKRIYEPPSDDDGFRVYVERLWPRGISKQKAAIDLWMKDIAPSTDLRKWFNHDPKKWAGFKRKYYTEIHKKRELIAEIAARLDKGNVTLLYSSKELQYNAANALLAYLDKLSVHAQG